MNSKNKGGVLVLLVCALPAFAVQPDEGGIGGTGHNEVYQYNPFELPDTLQELAPPDINETLSRDHLPEAFDLPGGMDRNSAIDMPAAPEAPAPK